MLTSLQGPAPLDDPGIRQSSGNQLLLTNSKFLLVPVYNKNPLRLKAVALFREFSAKAFQ